MRVSESFSHRTFLDGLERTRRNLERALAQMASGRRVSVGSDDPQAAREILRLTEEIGKLATRRRTIGAARPWLEATERAVGEVGDVLNAALQYAVQGASDTAGDEGRRALARQVAALRDRLASLAESRLGGRYIFSGTRTDTPPYDAAGAYQGNASSIEIPLDDRRLAINLTAPEVFGESGVGGPIDLLERLQQALESGTADDVHALVEPLREAIADNGERLAELGARRSRLEDADVRIGDRILDLQRRRSELADADLAEVLSEVQRLETQYQASLEAGARIASAPTLFDYIG
ncbi:MAG: hypothetical protein D6718_03705 [Acidobacteria bacterium]|nr:MAG: hypothetical protein D6718_03705 [Acidobacteriota bacterium]